MTDRDERLGHDLRTLNVPAHGADFFPRLAQLLDQEPARRTPKRRRLSRQPPMFIGLAAAAVLIAVVAASTMFAKNPQKRLRPGPAEPRLISATEVRTRVSTALSSLRSLSGEVAIERLCVANVSCAESGHSTQRWSFVTTAAGD